MFAHVLAVYAITVAIMIAKDGLDNLIEKLNINTASKEQKTQFLQALTAGIIRQLNTTFILGRSYEKATLILKTSFKTESLMNHLPYLLEQPPRRLFNFTCFKCGAYWRAALI